MFGEGGDSIAVGSNRFVRHKLMQRIAAPLWFAGVQRLNIYFHLTGIHGVGENRYAAYTAITLDNAAASTAYSDFVNPLSPVSSPYTG